MIKNFFSLAIALVVIGFVHVSLERSAQGQRFFRNRCCQNSCASARRGRVLHLFSQRGRCCPSPPNICCATPMEGPCECVAPPAPCCGSKNSDGAAPGDFSHQDGG